MRPGHSGSACGNYQCKAAHMRATSYVPRTNTCTNTTTRRTPTGLAATHNPSTPPGAWSSRPRTHGRHSFCCSTRSGAVLQTGRTGGLSTKKLDERPISDCVDTAQAGCRFAHYASTQTGAAAGLEAATRISCTALSTERRWATGECQPGGEGWLLDRSCVGDTGVAHSTRLIATPWSRRAGRWNVGSYGRDGATGEQ